MCQLQQASASRLFSADVFSMGSQRCVEPTEDAGASGLAQGIKALVPSIGPTIFVKLVKVWILLLARPYEAGSPSNKSARQALSPLCLSSPRSGVSGTQLRLRQHS